MEAFKKRSAIQGIEESKDSRFKAHKGDGLRVPNVSCFIREIMAVIIGLLFKLNKNEPFLHAFSEQKKLKNEGQALPDKENT